MSESFSPELVRSHALYIQQGTQRALRMIAEATNQTADGLANDVLSQWLQTHHDGVLVFMAKRRKEELEFQRQLKAKLKPPEEQHEQ